MAKLNRNEIRAALKAYEVSREQHEAILTDHEIQSLFAADADSEANRLIDARYPFGRWEKVRGYGIALITAMYRDVPVSIDPEQVWRSPKHFKEACDIASRV